jgi:hypothetical protein
MTAPIQERQVAKETNDGLGSSGAKLRPVERIRRCRIFGATKRRRTMLLYSFSLWTDYVDTSEALSTAANIRNIGHVSLTAKHETAEHVATLVLGTEICQAADCQWRSLRSHVNE